MVERIKGELFIGVRAPALSKLVKTKEQWPKWQW